MLRSSLVFVLATTLIVSAQSTVDSVVGEWAYKHKKQKTGPNLYPPEFIHLTLAKDGEGLRGNFSARYNVPQMSPVSPDVNFELRSIDETAQHFNWKASDGGEGTFTIAKVEGKWLRIEWRRTNRVPRGALSKGEATLARQ